MPSKRHALENKGQIPWASQEHGQPSDTVCALQPVDGAQKLMGMGARGWVRPQAFKGWFEAGKRL